MRVSFLFAVLALLALFATVSAMQMHDEASELSRAMESWSSDESLAFAEVDSELDAEMEAEMEDLRKQFRAEIVPYQRQQTTVVRVRRTGR